MVIHGYSFYAGREGDESGRLRGFASMPDMGRSRRGDYASSGLWLTYATSDIEIEGSFGVAVVFSSLKRFDSFYIGGGYKTRSAAAGSLRSEMLCCIHSS
jgi:hypothetical protein